jgi:hypothetical protein
MTNDLNAHHKKTAERNERSSMCDAPTTSGVDGLDRLLSLPLDCLSDLLGRLDTRSLVRFAEGVSSQLRLLLEPVLSELWPKLHAELLSQMPIRTTITVFGPACPPLSPKGTDKACFARAYAALQHRCPKCGRRGTARRAAVSSDPEDEQYVDVNRYMHLCEWLLLPPASVSQS